MKIQRFAGNFKPTFWSKYIQTELAKDLVIANWTDYKFEGEIKYGERVKIVGAVRPTIGTYVPGTDINIEHLGDNAQYLDIDYADYFAFEVDDVSELWYGAYDEGKFFNKIFDTNKVSKLNNNEDSAVSFYWDLGNEVSSTKRIRIIMEK